MKFVDETPIKDKKVLLRTDFNVDLSENGKILSDFRIRAALPTIHYLLKNGVSKIIIIAHLGKPKGRDPEFSFKVVADHLIQLLNRPVIFVDDCKGEKVKIAINSSPNSSILFLENLRFYEEEEKNDENFAKELATLADVYVNDAFGVCHRNAASVVAITKFLPSFGGLLLKKEIENLNKVMAGFERPLVLILGGAKISTKLPLIKSFSAMADSILLGGALVNTILKAWSFFVGQSLVEDEMISEASKIGSAKAELILAGDFLVGPSTDVKVAEIRRLGEVRPQDKILDIGPASQAMFSDIIKKAKTIVWNGPMGYFENPVFSEGTKKIIEAIVASSAFSVVGGGETLTALEEWSFFDKISFVSTGGGAMLSYLAKEKMPGLEALS